jgi:hypothetical protein
LGLDGSLLVLQRVSSADDFVMVIVMGTNRLTILLSPGRKMLNIFGLNCSISGLKTRTPHADHLVIVLSCCRNIWDIFGTKLLLSVLQDVSIADDFATVIFTRTN